MVNQTIYRVIAYVTRRNVRTLWGRLFGLTGMIGTERRREYFASLVLVLGLYTRHGDLSSTLYAIMQVFIFYLIPLIDRVFLEYPALLAS